MAFTRVVIKILLPGLFKKEMTRRLSKHILHATSRYVSQHERVCYYGKPLKGYGFKIITSLIIIRVTFNIESDTLQFVKVGSPM